ncbi:MAG: hypothetical protein U7123_23030 [Potamolinea sp.]
MALSLEAGKFLVIIRLRCQLSAFSCQLSFGRGVAFAPKYLGITDNLTIAFATPFLLFDQLLITNYSLPITHYQLPITNYQLAISH